MILLGDFGDEMGGSHFLKVIHGRKPAGRRGSISSAELAVQNALRDLIRGGWVRSAHDCSEGGLAVALAESCFNPDGSLGARIDLGRRPANGGSIKSSSTKLNRGLSFLPCRRMS